MKKKHLLSILVLVLLCVTACQDTLENEPIKKQIESNTPAFEPSNITREEIPDYVDAYLQEFPELFGNNVLVFNTWEELDSELESLHQMTYTEHREWLSAHHLNSPILNSLIIHDSVQTAVWEEFGMNFDIPFPGDSDLGVVEEYFGDEERQQMEELAFERYDEIMSNEYAEYVKTEYEEDGSIILSPLGVLDERIFCNDNNLFICEGMVIKYFEDGILSCPIDEYMTYSEINLAQAIDTTSSHRILVWPNARNDKTFESTNSEQYMTRVNFHISVTKAWFFFERKLTTMHVTNYHKRRDGSYRNVACWTSIDADVDVTCVDGTLDYHFRPVNWFRKSSTFYRIHYSICGCPYTYFSHIRVDSRNQHGVEIHEDQTFTFTPIH